MVLHKGTNIPLLPSSPPPNYLPLGIVGSFICILYVWTLIFLSKVSSCLHRFMNKPSYKSATIPQSSAIAADVYKLLSY